MIKIGTHRKKEVTGLWVPKSHLGTERTFLTQKSDFDQKRSRFNHSLLIVGIAIFQPNWYQGQSGRFEAGHLTVHRVTRTNSCHAASGGKMPVGGNPCQALPWQHCCLALVCTHMCWHGQCTHSLLPSPYSDIAANSLPFESSRLESSLIQPIQLKV